MRATTRVLVALLFLTSCKVATPPSGYGVDLTIEYADLPGRALVRRLDVTTTGAEMFSLPITLPASVQKTAIVRTRYVPLVQNGSLTFTIDALDVNGNLLGSARQAVTLVAKQAVSVTITLTPVSGGSDGSVVIDMGPPLAEPGAACMTDADCATNSCVDNVCELASGPPYWVAQVSLPVARNECAGWGADTIYVAGGFTNAALAADTLRYDPTMNSWCGTCGTALVPGPMMTPRAYFASASTATTLFAIAGSDATTLLGTVEAFDLTKQTWSTTTTMLATPRVNAGAAIGSDGLIYVCGGRTAPANGQLKTVETIDPTSFTVGAAAALPTALEYVGVAADIQGRIVVTGGASATTVFGTVTILTPGATAWTMGPSLVTPRIVHAAVRGADGRIYVAGGNDVNGMQLASVEVLTPDADHWTAAAPLTAARSEMAAARAPDGRIWMSGGLTPMVNGDAGVTPTASAIVDAYGPIFLPNPTSGKVGDGIDLALTNFAAGSHVTVTLTGMGISPTGAAEGTTDTTGKLSPFPAWTVPALAPGTYVLTAVDDRSRYPVTATFTVK